jgi:hypothetical protein
MKLDSHSRFSSRRLHIDFWRVDSQLLFVQIFEQNKYKYALIYLMIDSCEPKSPRRWENMMPLTDTTRSSVRRMNPKCAKKLVAFECRIKSTSILPARTGTTVSRRAKWLVGSICRMLLAGKSQPPQINRLDRLICVAPRPPVPVPPGYS